MHRRREPDRMAASHLSVIPSRSVARRRLAGPGAAALLAVAAVAGCATKGTAPAPVDEAPPVESRVPEPPGARRAVPRGPVLALLDRAARAERAGDLEAAAAAVERALRFAPRDARLWHRLARIRLAQGMWQRAEALARRSLALAPRDRALGARNWRVIAAARAGRGDRVGAERARRHAEALEGARG